MLLQPGCHCVTVFEIMVDPTLHGVIIFGDLYTYALVCNIVVHPHTLHLPRKAHQGAPSEMVWEAGPTHG